MRIQKYCIWMLATCLTPISCLLAQEETEKIDKSVQVVRTYKPKVKDAYKIDELPEITDTTQSQPDFNYYILPKRVQTTFEVEPIPAATMVSEPITELYGNYINLAMGNKFAPLAEISLTNKRAKKRAYGVFLRHHSSAGKVPLGNNIKQKTGYALNQVTLFGKQIFSNADLNAQFDLNSNTRYFYGYNTNIQDTNLRKDDIRQNLTSVGFELGYKSTYLDSAHLNYDLQINGHHLNDKFNTQENLLTFSADFDRFFDNYHAGIQTGYSYLQHESEVDSLNNNLLEISPWIAKYGDDWRIQGGVRFFADKVDGNTRAQMYPSVHMEYDMVSQYFIPYGGVDGKLNMNPYQSATNKNPYILPGTRIQNTNLNMILYAGIRGHLGPSTFYNASVKYSIFENMHFFVNEYGLTDSMANQFNVAYSDGEKTNLFGELSFELSDELNLRLKGNYYDYTLYDQSKPWHKPQYDLTVTGRYDLRDKIILETDLFLCSERWVNPPSKNSESTKLKGFADLNLNLEYRYSKVLSGYLKVQNILGNNFAIWQNYPVYGLQVFLGVTYAF